MVGAALLLAAGAAFVWFLFRAWDGFADVEAHVPSDGVAHQVTVSPDGEKFFWAQEYDAADCDVRDLGRRAVVDLRPINGTYNRSAGNYHEGVWFAEARFDGGSGRLEVTCATTGGPAEIGPAVDVVSFVTSLLLAILLPLALGGAGLAVILVTAVLWVTRPARTS